MDALDLDTSEDEAIVVEERPRVGGQVLKYGSSSEDDEEIRRQAQDDNTDSTGIAFLEFAEAGDVANMSRMLEENTELIHFKDCDGYTALHRAAYSEKPEAVKMLLDCGADILAKTGDGWTPLHSACKWNSAKCVKMLLQQKADINSKTNGGLTPLHLAAENPIARDTLIILLLNPELQADIKNSSGETAEVIAARHGPFSYLFELANKAVNTI